MAKSAYSFKLHFTMDDLKRMAVFATVVQHRSMSGAARALGMSPSAVSQQVRQLEREGGVTLLHRSTRKLALTEAGERVHLHCATMVQAAAQARAELVATRDAPSGVLRMSTTVGFARHVEPALGDLLARHPALRLRVLVDDASIDLINARVDLAIRFGSLADSSWAARRLGSLQWWLCALPAMAGLCQRQWRPATGHARTPWRTARHAPGAPHFQQQPAVHPADVRGRTGCGHAGQHRRAR